MKTAPRRPGYILGTKCNGDIMNGDTKITGRGHNVTGVGAQCYDGGHNVTRPRRIYCLRDFTTC